MEADPTTIFRRDGVSLFASPNFEAHDLFRSRIHRSAEELVLREYHAVERI